MVTRLRIVHCLIVALALLCISAAADDAPKTEIPATYRPVVKPVVPTVKGMVRTDIDKFILAALEAKQLSMNPEADRATLIRRVSFDLTGLPPTVAELDAFLNDKAADAYPKMVERYLASPRYGERWGKYWLDAAGYADSNGYFNADSDRSLAWKYRDYVVKSFNADKPYDQFVREQLAGDELAGYSPEGDVTPAMLEKLVATHFLRNAPDGTGESDGNPDEVRIDRFTVVEGTVQNMVNCLLGLTVQCARCHDHKFEPISQKEYYGLQALVFPVYNPAKWTKPNDRVVLIGTRAEIVAKQRLNEQIDRQVKALKESLAAVVDPLKDQLLDEKLKDFDVKARTAILEAVKTTKEKRTAEQTALVKKHKKVIDIKDEELDKRFPSIAEIRDKMLKAIKERENERPTPAEKISAFVETDPKPDVHHVLKRGQHGSPGEEVQPCGLNALNTAKNKYQIEPPAAGRISTGRRTAFAKWVTSAENPLFARVMVNRVWQHHFGTGIVATADNLGISGSKPSHPELLDYLATEFVRTGWSVKKLHRLIMNSAVYQQSSSPRKELDAVDGENRLLAHFPLRRLDAEAIRDAMLHIGGVLDLREGGAYVPSKRSNEGVVEIEEKTEGAHRRSIYLQQRRTQVVTFLQLFDAPAMVSTCGKRSPSTVPLQSLTLLNSEFARGISKSFAERLIKEAGSDAKKRLDHAFRLACSRSPLPDELAKCESFLEKQRQVYVKEKDADNRAWTDLCQMLYASNAFLYVE